MTSSAAPDGAVGAPDQADRPWTAIVWNDPVNLMSYVAHIFITVLGHHRQRAYELMLTVHEQGKATVASGDRDAIEHAVLALQTAGLWATMQQGGR